MTQPVLSKRMVPTTAVSMGERERLRRHLQAAIDRLGVSLGQGEVRQWLEALSATPAAAIQIAIVPVEEPTDG